MRVSTRSQDITFEYDLPLSARVTIAIINPGSEDDPQIIAVRESLAGWTRLRATTQDVPIEAGAAYRITAERGSSDNAETYWIGQYQQVFTFDEENPPLAARPFRVALPVVTYNWQPPLPAPNEIWNGDFRQESWLDPPGEVTLPAYWDIQASFSTQDDGAYNLPVSELIRRIPNVRTSDKNDYRMSFNAVPGARAELSQRINPDWPGSYRLAFTLEIPQVLADSTTSLEVRVRSVQTGQVAWRQVIQFTDLTTNRDYRPVAFVVDDITGPVILSFLATFDPVDGQRKSNQEYRIPPSRFYIGDVTFTRTPCTPLTDPCPELAR